MFVFSTRCLYKGDSLYGVLMSYLHRLRLRLDFTAACLAALTLGSTGAGAESTFQGLGDLPGGDFLSEAKAVSDNGVVVGYSWSRPNTAANSASEAFRWTAAEGMVGLGDLPGGGRLSHANGVSADGTVIVGFSKSSRANEAFQWTQSGGMVGLGFMSSSIFLSVGNGISGHGRLLVGSSFSSVGTQAFRWSLAGGMEGLGDVAGGGTESEARDASADGSVVVGRGRSALGKEAFRWTRAGGMEGLGDLPGGIFRSEANAISADGSVIVGFSNSENTIANQGEAFRWTAAEGMVALGVLPGPLFHSQATDVSGDGSVIVGTSTSAGQTSTPFIWTESEGMRKVYDVLSELGVDLTGWSLENVRGISSDGRTLVGWGKNPDGRPEAWIAILDGIRDDDADGVSNHIDNCPDVFNPSQDDRDSDGVGNACNDEDDFDGDEWADRFDNCEFDANPEQRDVDLDGVGDVCDPFPDDPDNEQAQCEEDLEFALDDLDECLFNRVFRDGDDDGEEDSTDTCPDTERGVLVDDAGCSRAQFCGAIDAYAKSGKRLCKKSDWGNDSPLARPRDCRAYRGICKPRNHRARSIR